MTIVCEVECLPYSEQKFSELQSIVAAVDKRLAILEDREGRESVWLKVIMTILGTVVLGFGSWMWYITTNVVAIKQQLADGGNKQIVAELRTPKSPQQLLANLSTVIAQVQTARSDGKAADLEKVSSISSALAEVIQRNPNLPEAWQAAANLVDYKYQSPRSAPLVNCLDTLPGTGGFDRMQTTDGVIDFPNLSGPQTPGWMSHVYLGNCTLKLDDDGTFDSTSVGKFFAEVRKHHPQASRFVLVLENAHVTYSGGNILPVTEIQFTNCTFDLTPPASLPNKWDRALATDLLVASLDHGNIYFPS